LFPKPSATDRQQQQQQQQKPPNNFQTFGCGNETLNFPISFPNHLSTEHINTFSLTFIEKASMAVQFSLK
jgi:hypothetical protein